MPRGLLNFNNSHLGTILLSSMEQANFCILIQHPMGRMSKNNKSIYLEFLYKKISLSSFILHYPLYPTLPLPYPYTTPLPTLPTLSYPYPSPYITSYPPPYSLP